MVDGGPGALFGRHPADAHGPAASARTIPAAVLDAVIRQAARTPGKAALIDGTRSLGYRELATLVPATARGLARRGVRPGDLGGVHLDCACDLTLAVHAVAAAGAVPLLLPPGADVAELAGLLVDSQARFLFTSAALSGPALAATERSYVRQVFAFGEVAGATPVAELPVPAPPGEADRPVAGPPHDPALWTPRGRLSHADLLSHISRRAATLQIDGTDVLVAAAAEFARAAETWLGLIHLALAHGATFVAVPGPGGPSLLTTAGRHRATVAVTIPDTLRALAACPTCRPPAGLRVAVIGRPSPQAADTCRRHGWTVVDVQ
ncbi:AMP-binding enzyme [Thermomonospora echinospora]|uniref:AMP-binding enzyme n=1 Tax=Thermomonospora echinospora TaxID=1992 RepID=A0A1H5X3Q5_9ACTN|nr:AMP-binding protein [Thermomonospora echinospora]SEG06414.1 AMP-binding enzyme [Thermomonospora echinospora]